MKKILAILLGMLLLGVIVIPRNDSTSSISVPEDRLSNSSAMRGNSFHDRTVNDSSWYAVKLLPSSPAEIKELRVNISGDIVHARENVRGFILTNFTTYHYMWSHRIIQHNESDRFFHASVGPFNYTYNTLTYDNSTCGGVFTRWNISLSATPWYLVAMTAPAVDVEIEVRINTTDDVVFAGSTEGNDTFLYSSEAFWGNVNVRFPHFVSVANGEKTVDVEHTFFGWWFSSFMGYAIERLRYTTPDGDTTTGILLQIPGLVAANFGTIVGESGRWIFELDMLAFQKPWIEDAIYCSLIGADVKLP